MKSLRRLFRIWGLLGHLALGLLLAFFVLRRCGGRRDGAIVSWWLGRMARLFGVSMSVHGKAAQGPLLHVSNHVSWLDICVIGGLVRGHFLSKIEVRHWPVVGWLAARAGTLFISRGGLRASEQAVERIAFELRRGAKVVVFPEATTSDGKTVKRFHPRLFASAHLAKAAIQPLSLSYPAAGAGESLAPFIGDANLVQHAWAILGEKHTPVEVRFLPLVSSEGRDRRALAEVTRQAIASSIRSEHVPGQRQG